MSWASAKVFLSHASEARDVALRLQAQLRQHGHEAFAFEADLPFGDPVWRTIAEHIRACDHFLVLLSKGTYESESVSRELGLATTLRNERGSRPIIIGVHADPDRNWTAEPLRILHFDSKREIGKYDFQEPRYYAPTFDDIADLAEQLGVKVLRIEEIDGEHHDLFSASLRLYQQLFPPEEQDPPDAIMQWLHESRQAEFGLMHSPWREVWAVMHTGRTAIGFAYLSLHLDSHWCFANYIGVDPCWRQDSRADGLLKWAKEHLEQLDPRCQGILFEVDPIDATAPDMASDEVLVSAIKCDEHLAENVRRIRRLLLYKGLQATMLQNGREPLAYWQPPLEAPLESSRNVKLHLMGKLFMPDADPVRLAERAIDFLYDDLYGDGYGGRYGIEIPGFLDYVHQLKNTVKRQMMDEHYTFEPFRLPESWLSLLRRAKEHRLHETHIRL